MQAPIVTQYPTSTSTSTNTGTSTGTGTNKKRSQLQEVMSGWGGRLPILPYGSGHPGPFRSAEPPGCASCACNAGAACGRSPPPGRKVAGGVARSLLIVSGDRPSCTRARHMTHEHMSISHNTSNGIDQTRPMPTQDDITSQKLWSQMVLSQTQIAKIAKKDI